MPESHLLLADHRADALYRIDVVAGCAERVGRGTAAEHAGLLALPASSPGGLRWAFVDDQDGSLVAIGDTEISAPVAIPAEHVACSADGRTVAVSTGLGLAERGWSDLVSVVDLATGRASRIRVRAGEPGVAIVADRATGADTLVLRHREPGAIEAISLSEVRAAGPHCPVLRGMSTTDVGDDGHGDAYDPVTATLFVATGRGLERFAVEDGRVVALPRARWPVPGRAYHLRFDPVTRSVVAALRGGDPDPRAWDTWRNWLFRYHVDTGTCEARVLGDGLVFRPAVGGGRVAASVIHPGGDSVVVGAIADAGQALRSTAIAPMSAAPKPGIAPWDGEPGLPAQRRSVAVSPDGTTVAVTAGGDGVVELLGDDVAARRIDCPTPLHEGGQLIWLPAEAPASVDTIGR